MEPLLSGMSGPDALVVAGVYSRMAAAVVAGTLPLVAGGGVWIRLGLAAALAVVATPAALAAHHAPHGASIGSPVGVVLGELLVGLALGTAMAAVAAAAGWAGGILGSVSGLTWADDFDPVAGGETAGIARLCWWVGMAAFCAAGGQLAVVGAVVDSVREVPVGTAFGGPPQEWLVVLAVRTPAVAVSVAAMLALPALAAVVAFHMVSSICLRAVSFVAGAGFLQGLASVVLLASLWLGAEAWAGGGAIAMLRAIDGCRGGR